MVAKARSHGAGGGDERLVERNHPLRYRRVPQVDIAETALLHGDHPAGRAAAGPEPRRPTFALIHRYDSPSGVIGHVDCYRLRDPGEALDLDFPGLLRAARLLLIEWPERAGCYAPPADAHLHFEHGEAPDMRRLERLA